MTPKCGNELASCFIAETLDTGSVDSPGSNPSPFMPPPNNIYDVLKIVDVRVRNAWLRGYRKEFKNLVDHDTFDLNAIPEPSDTILPILDDLRVKILPDGNLDKLKARFCVRGDIQKRLMPLLNSWAPTATHRALKSFIAVAASLGEDLWLLDFVGAFLQAPMRSRVFVKLLAVFSELFPEFKQYCGRPLLLNKSMYGQCVSGQYWYEELTDYLVQEEGFTQSAHAPTLYTKCFDDGSCIWLLNYVDDMLYFSTSSTTRKTFEQRLQKRFDLELKGKANWYLSMQITQLENKDKIIDQNRYLQSVLQRFLGSVRLPVSSTKHTTPLPRDFVASKDHLCDNAEASKALQEQYNLDFRAFIGCLIYLMYTRVDIVFVVNKLAKFTHCPSEYHLKCAVHLLCYLRDFPTYGIRFYSDWTHSRTYRTLQVHNIPSESTIVGYSDSSWQDCPDTARSTGGYIITFQGGAIDFSSNVPSPVALSSAEAEYNQACLACMSLAHIKMLVEDTTLRPITEAVPLLLDNKSAVDMGQSFKSSKHT